MTRVLPRLHLPHSPLVAVLFQVRFAAVLQIADAVPEIQDRLRGAGYPVFQEQPRAEVSGDPEVRFSVATKMRWLFSDRTQQQTITLTPEFVALQSRRYQSFDVFVKDLEAILSIVTEVADIGLYERFGLRYVNQIVPKQQEQLSQYLVPALAGVSPETLAVADLGVLDATSKTMVVAGTAIGGRLNIRVEQRVANDNSSPVGVASQTTEPLLAACDRTTGVLDIDHYLVRRTDPSPSAVVDLAWKLHGFVEVAFRTSVTDYAVSQWGGAR